MAVSRSRLFMVTLLLLAAAVSACSRDAQPSGDHEPDSDYGLWVGEEPANWPRIAMVSRIRYSDSNHPVGPSAFLLQDGDEIVAVTAKHVLRFFKSEAMDSVSFRGTLVSWEMVPKDAPTDVTVLGALINEDEEESLEGIPVARDWILFTVESTSKSVTPLRLRSTPLKKGETVFVVGWRYTDEGRQHVYPGKYVRSEKGSVLIDIRELVDNTIPGLSGAPVIDTRGHVVGLMSQKAGKLQRLASIDYPRKVLDEQLPGA